MTGSRPDVRMVSAARRPRIWASSRTFSWLLALLLALIWGSAFILIKRGLDAFSPLQVGGLRIIIAGLVLLPFSLGQVHRISRRELKAIFMVGLIANAIPAFLFPLAETHISSASAGILNVLSPLFALIFGYLFFNAKFSGRKIFGVLVGLIGSILLIVMGDNDIDLGSQVIYSLYAVLATACYGLTANIAKTYLNHTPVHLASAFALQMMAIPYVFILLWTGVADVFKTDVQAWESLGFIAVLGVVGTALSLVLFHKLVQISNAVVSSSAMYLVPIVAVGWGLLDGEAVNLWQCLGMGIILSGVYLVSGRPNRTANQQRE